MVFLSRRLRIGAPDVAHTFGLFCDTGVALLLNRFVATTSEVEAADPGLTERLRAREIAAAEALEASS